MTATFLEQAYLRMSDRTTGQVPIQELEEVAVQSLSIETKTHGSSLIDRHLFARTNLPPKIASSTLALLLILGDRVENVELTEGGVWIRHLSRAALDIEMYSVVGMIKSLHNTQ